MPSIGVMSVCHLLLSKDSGLGVGGWRLKEKACMRAMLGLWTHQEYSLVTWKILWPIFYGCVLIAGGTVWVTIGLKTKIVGLDKMRRDRVDYIRVCLLPFLCNTGKSKHRLYGFCFGSSDFICSPSEQSPAWFYETCNALWNKALGSHPGSFSPPCFHEINYYHNTLL